MDQSNRYADLSLREDELIRGGQHILVAYTKKPKSGVGYLEAAAHFAAESSTGTNVEVSTTDDFTRGIDALVYPIDEAGEQMRVAYPLDLFDRDRIDGRMMMVSFRTLAIGNNQGMGGIQHAKMIDFWMPPRAIQLFDGPAKDISDLWRILGRPVMDGGYIAGTIIKPKLGLRPEPFARARRGAVTSPSSKRGYTACVLAKMARLLGASGVHVGTMDYRKMEGERDDRAIACVIERDSDTGPIYHREW